MRETIFKYYSTYKLKCASIFAEKIGGAFAMQDLILFWQWQAVFSHTRCLNFKNAIKERHCWFRTTGALTQNIRTWFGCSKLMTFLVNF